MRVISKGNSEGGHGYPVIRGLSRLPLKLQGWIDGTLQDLVDGGSSGPQLPRDIRGGGSE